MLELSGSSSGSGWTSRGHGVGTGGRPRPEYAAPATALTRAPADGGLGLLAIDDTVAVRVESLEALGRPGKLVAVDDAVTVGIDAIEPVAQSPGFSLETTALPTAFGRAGTIGPIRTPARSGRRSGSESAPALRRVEALLARSTGAATHACRPAERRRAAVPTLP